MSKCLSDNSVHQLGLPSSALLTGGPHPAAEAAVAARSQRQACAPMLFPQRRQLGPEAVPVGDLQPGLHSAIAEGASARGPCSRRQVRGM